MKQIKRAKPAKTVKKKAAKKKVEPNKDNQAASTSPGADKVFDISKPGESIADPSSKPIITTSKGAPVQDPMVTPQEPQDAPEAASGEPMPSAASAYRPVKNRIEPLKHDEGDDTSAATKEDDGLAEPPKENGLATPPDEAPAPDVTPPSDGSEGTNTDEEDSSDDSADGGDLSPQDKQQQAKTADQVAAEKREEQANALIASRAYFVPINSVKNRRSMRMLLLVVIIFLALAGFLYAWDAGLVNIGTKPPFNFIPDK